MKALTIKQPWAWAILHGGEDIENAQTIIEVAKGVRDETNKAILDQLDF